MSWSRSTSSILSASYELQRSARASSSWPSAVWAQKEVQLLGFTIADGVRRVDPKNAEAMRTWPEPRSTDDVTSFLAFANFAREFIPVFHEHARHLRPLAKKGAKFGALWSPECSRAFSS